MGMDSHHGLFLLLKSSHEKIYPLMAAQHGNKSIASLKVMAVEVDGMIGSGVYHSEAAERAAWSYRPDMARRLAAMRCRSSRSIPSVDRESTRQASRISA